MKFVCLSRAAFGMGMGMGMGMGIEMALGGESLTTFSRLRSPDWIELKGRGEGPM